jgi:2-polyprenyl-3-methyl-5-hydroxy-6-metoxy-1,4-benzoquinol methylase
MGGQLAKRSRLPELMDDGLGDTQLHARVLADLAAVNRLTLTHRPVLQFLRQAWSALPEDKGVTVLDVGSGQGDLLRSIWQLGQRQLRPVRLLGLDLQEDSTRAARAATPPAMGIEYITGDLFAHRPRDVDYIVSSQLAHHLDDDRIVEFLRWLHRHARRSWCVADLRRHWLPYLGFPWLARAARWHRIVRIDGTRSIARACTLQEWQQLIDRADVPAQVRGHLPFRLTVQSQPAHRARAR